MPWGSAVGEEFPRAVDVGQFDPPVGQDALDGGEADLMDRDEVFVGTRGQRAAGEMAAVLEEWVRATTDAAAEKAASRGLAPDEEAKLRSLGYLGGDAFRTGTVEGGPRADPKDGIAEVRRLDEALS